MDLSEIFHHYGSDKDINGYTALYHLLFDKMRDQPLKILEIGIGTMLPGVHSSMQGYALPGYKPGGSLRAWRDYFPKSEVVGVDVQPDTQFTEDRIKTYLADSTKEEEVVKLFKTLKDDKFDIIVDDGSHYDENQFLTLKHFYPHVKDGGIYIVEDIYPGSKLSTTPERLGNYCNKDPYVFCGVRNNMCVIYKKHLKRETRVNY